AASDRIFGHGTREISKILRTGPCATIPRSAEISRPCRAISQTGTKPISVTSSAISAAQADGMENDRSTSVCWSPRSIPQISGTELRKLTAPTRILDLYSTKFQCIERSLAGLTRRVSGPTDRYANEG